MALRDEFIRLGNQLAEERDAAFSLWTWLPSYKEAEKHHGDYAGEHMPSVADIIKEASMFIAHGLNPTDEQRKEAGEWYQCPCGEPHEEGNS